MSSLRRFIPGPVKRAPWFAAAAVFMGVVMALPQGPSPSAGTTLTPFQRRKAEYFLRERYACLGCHQLNGEGGRIGPDLTDVNARRSRSYIEAMIRTPEQVVLGTAMPRAPMPEPTLQLLVSYFSGSEDAIGEPAHDLSGNAITTPLNGEALYAARCAPCHGPAGRGDGTNASRLPVAPALLGDSASMVTRPDDALYDAIFAGGFVMGRSNRMPGFGHTLTPDQIRSLVAHIRALCRCAGPVWSRDGRDGERPHGP